MGRRNSSSSEPERTSWRTSHGTPVRRGLRERALSRPALMTGTRPHDGRDVTSGARTEGTALGSLDHPGKMGIHAPCSARIAEPCGDRRRWMKAAPSAGFCAFNGTVTENRIGAGTTFVREPVDEMIWVESAE